MTCEAEEKVCEVEGKILKLEQVKQALQRLVVLCDTGSAGDLRAAAGRRHLRPGACLHRADDGGDDERGLPIETQAWIMKQEKYTDNKLVLFGGIATAIAALCCFTPLLVWGVTTIGAAALVSYLDYALLPLLALFGAMTFIGIQQVVQCRRTSGWDGDCCDLSESPD